MTSPTIDLLLSTILGPLGHKIAWDTTKILTATRYKTQLDLTIQNTAIKTRNPSLNRANSAPTCSKLIPG